MAGATLDTAKKNKKNEFYTQLCDIEKELRHYKKHFAGKVVYCNCDDPYESNFFKYFALNFNELKLKKLIATSYAGSSVVEKQLRLFDVEEYKHDNFTADKKPYKIVINEVTDENNDGAIDLTDVEILIKNKKNTLTLLNKDGDFRSDESIELLKTADIVVTNPPFSLFREYVEQLMKYEKKFIIIGRQTAITCKDFFPLIKDNKLWRGYGFKGNAGFFISPYEDYAAASSHKEGLIRVPGITWYTNLDITCRHEELTLYKKYTPENYPKYDNYDAIDVSKVVDIPYDYDGVMGVPITFLDKYNPEQFEIVGLGNCRDNFTPIKDYINPKKIKKDGKVVNSGAINCVLALEVDEKPKDKVYYISDNSKYLIAPFARILIRRKQG